MEQRCVVGVGKLRENQIQVQTCRNRIHLLRRLRGNVVWHPVVASGHPPGF